ncbi:LysR family transcriptional regulator [Pelagibius marinus]|uniref:LysR family transcriptional regulator n=1 Tax=Pelagibius marinus TaxID=2762760 RepID=UPI0018728B23|nr:LysR family transcriptional regulator [Pelagibius marinus]
MQWNLLAMQENWEHLRYFLALARSGNLAVAARQLGKAPATVWRHLESLEGDLGTRLFDQRRGGYRLSEKGQLLLRQAEAVESEIFAAHQSVAQRHVQVAGEVRLTAPEFLAVWLAETLLPDLLSRHRGLAVEIVTAMPAAGLSRRESDLALRFDPVIAKDFANEASFDIGFGVYAAAAYEERYGRAETPERFAGQRLIGFDDTSGHVAPQRWLSRGAREAEVVLRSNSAALRKAAAERGLGVTLLPSLMGDASAQLEAWFPGSQLGRLPLHVLTAERVRQYPRVRLVRDRLLAHLDRHRAALAG